MAEDAILAVQASATETPPPTTEPPKTEAPAPEKAPEAVAGKFAALAAKERAAVQRAQALKAREADIAAREARIAESEKSRAGYAQDPVKLLTDFGLSPEQAINAITQRMLGQPAGPEQKVEALEARLRAFEANQQAQREAAEKAQAEALQSARTAAVEDFKGSVSEFVKANAETFELAAMEDDVAAVVYEITEAHFEKTKSESETGKGEVLTVKQAVELYEKHLEAKAERMLKAKKIAARLAPAPPKEDAPRSLSNSMMGASSTSPAKTDQERMARALAVLEAATRT